jgi:hypothetical protein
MADEQEHLEDGWQARDLRSGVAKVFQEAKRRNILGIRAASAWAVIMLLFAIVDMAGVVAIGPPIWEFVAALGVMLLAALAMSRTPGPMLVAAIVILADLATVGFRLPQIFERRETTELALTSIRVTLAPVALTMVLSGYLGALSIQAFKLGFSPGQDWRTRLNPMMLQFAVIGSCMAVVVIGVASWFGAIGAGFAQTGVKWTNVDPYVNNVGVDTARPDIEEAERVGKDPEPFINLRVLTGEEEDIEPEVPSYPDAAKPITSLKGWDEFGQREIEDAWEFAADTDQAGCVNEGLGRQGRCRDDRCRHWSRVFVRACLAKAKKTEKYCEGVPEPTKVKDGFEWSTRLCAGRNYDMCREIQYAVQGHCHPPENYPADIVDGSAARVHAEKKAAGR